MKFKRYFFLLRRKGFFFFLLTQFLGAMNDNVYRLVVSLIIVGKSLQGEGVSLTAMVFLLPAILFSGYAGYLADRFSKRNVLIVTKSFEVISMVLAFVALGTGYTTLMLTVLFLMATQSAFFSPAKYGIVPELVKRKQLSQANALLQMTTYVAIIVGSAFAGVLMHYFSESPAILSSILVLIAVLGVAASFQIGHVSPKDKNRRLAINPFSEIYAGIQLLKNHRFLTFVVLGICFFWMTALVFQLNLLVFASNVLSLGYLPVSIMQTVLALGIGAGAMLAGVLSGDRIEYGLIPLGLLGMGVSMLIMGTVDTSVTATYVLLIFASLFTGLFIVPLVSLQQVLPPKEERGRVIATTNVFDNLAMIAGAAGLWLCQFVLEWPPQMVFLIWGALTLVLTILAIYNLPAFFVRLVLWMIMHTLYRVKVFNEKNIPKNGAALLVCNHVSYIDALILSAVMPRFIRYLILKKYYTIRGLGWIMRLAQPIPIERGDEQKVEQALQSVREALKTGHVVCVFAEGSITRTGNLLPFKRGFERMVEGLDVPIIPVHLDKLWDSIFSFRGGKFFWKIPRRIPIDVTVSFGEPMPSTSTAWEVREVVQELATQTQLRAKTKRDILALKFIQAAKHRPLQLAIADNHDDKWTYGQLLAQSLHLASAIKKRYPDDASIGILLPPSVKSVWLNVACIIAGKIVVNLPYQHEKDVEQAIQSASLKKVITTSTFLDGLNLRESSTFDLIDQWYQAPNPVTLSLTQWKAFFMPSRWLLKSHGSYQPDALSPIAICYAAERDGKRLAVELSNRSILSPVSSFRQLFDNMNDTDKVIGVLPFHTSMGVLGTLWLPLLDGMTAIYHTRAKQDPTGVGKLIKQYEASIIFDMPDGYADYLEHIRPGDFSYIHYAICAVMPHHAGHIEAFSETFEERFGIELLTGYGESEVGPVCMNVPNIRMPGHLQIGYKLGSVGMPLPYVTIKLLNEQTLEPVKPGEKGLLWVKSPFKMLGYFGAPQKTKSVMTHGWFNTGVLASMDDDGFIFM